MNLLVRLVLSFAVCLPTLSFAADPAPWMVYENGYFKAFSNAEPDDVAEILADLELFRVVSRMVSPIPIPQGAKKTVAVIFRNHAEFQKYSPGRTLAAYAVFPKEMEIIVVSASYKAVYRRTGSARFLISTESDLAMENTIAEHVMRHEYAHVLQSYHGHKLPQWYREGLAEFLAAIRIDGNSFEIGHPPQWRRGMSAIVRYDRIVDDEFSLHKRSLVTNGGDTYWQAWLLTHYFLMGADDRMKDRFERYLESVDAGADSLRAFAESFGFEARSLWHKILKRYSKNAPTGSGKFDARRADYDFSRGEASEVEIRAILEFLNDYAKAGS